MMEQTFVMVKPDGVKRGLIGEIIGRFERMGLKIVALKMVSAKTMYFLSTTMPTIRKHFLGGVKKPFRLTPNTEKTRLKIWEQPIRRSLGKWSEAGCLIMLSRVRWWQ